MNTSAVGTFWSDYDDGDLEAHFTADVLRFIDRGDEIVFEFSGVDGDEGPYTGRCRLKRSADAWMGDGEFRMTDGTVVPASVKADRSESESFVHLSGDWLDRGDQQSASFEVEISKHSLLR